MINDVSILKVLKGNLRFLFSSDGDIRQEAICRLIWLLGKEKDSTKKLPRLSSLHGLPLSSLCIFERQTLFKKSEGNYQVTLILIFAGLTMILRIISYFKLFDTHDSITRNICFCREAIYCPYWRY